ncbi:hypothetical protein FB639_003636, partial [Coemansia asiatica]
MEDTGQRHSALPPADTEASLQSTLTSDSSLTAETVVRTTDPTLNTPAFATETSQLPARNSAGRVHSVSSRASPYSISHQHHNSGRHMTTGEAANIPRAAQYHAVGMPARHPLGIQTESMQSDVSSTESVDSNGAENASLMTASDQTSETLETAMESMETRDSHRMGASLGAVDEESEDDSDEDNVNNDSSNSNSNSNSNSDRDRDRDNGRDSRGRYRDEDILGTNERGSDRSTDYGVSIPANGSIIASSIADESRARSQKAAATASIPLGAHVFECPICLDTIQEAFMTAC